MFFNSETSPADIIIWVKNQIAYALPVSKNGLDIEIKPHKQKRSNEQNRFLMAIMVALVRFYHETGFVPSGCERWMMRTDILKEYWKARYGVEFTHKLDTGEFTKFIDYIQLTLVEETHGEWEILQTDSAYLKSLLQEY